jgi:hypothetical protein
MSIIKTGKKDRRKKNENWKETRTKWPLIHTLSNNSSERGNCENVTVEQSNVNHIGQVQRQVKLDAATYKAVIFTTSNDLQRQIKAKQNSAHIVDTLS